MKDWSDFFFMCAIVSVADSFLLALFTLGNSEK